MMEAPILTLRKMDVEVCSCLLFWERSDGLNLALSFVREISDPLGGGFLPCVFGGGIDSKGAVEAMAVPKRGLKAACCRSVRGETTTGSRRMQPKG